MRSILSATVRFESKTSVIAEVGQACAQAPQDTQAESSKAGVEPLDDAGVESAPGHAQHELALHFVAGPDAAGAVDARGQVRAHVGVAFIRSGIEMILPGRVADVGVGHAEVGRDDLQFSRRPAVSLEFFLRVIRQHQLENIPAQPLDALGLGIDVGILHERRVAGCLRLGDAALLQGDIDAADAAGTERLQVWRIAKGRDEILHPCACAGTGSGFPRPPFRTAGHLCRRSLSWSMSSQR